MKSAAFLLFAFGAGVALLSGQETKPRENPEAYLVHRKCGDRIIGAEYMVHTIATGERSFLAPYHLVVEVGVFPQRKIEERTSQFFLRVNHKDVTPEPWVNVAGTIKHDDEYASRPHPEITVGAGAAEVGLGQPQETARFPGDTRPQQGRLPKPPNPARTETAERAPEKSIDELLHDAALPEGEIAMPKAGSLFFLYRGKLKDIKSLELVYVSAGTEFTLPLL